jgi:hypothetical protein
LTVASEPPPRYLFLMRHAKHKEGHLTEEGSAHIRSLAMRFVEWVQAEWRTCPQQTIRVWYTTTSTEVQETANALAYYVLTRVRQGQHQAEPYPFDRPPKDEHNAEGSGNGRQPWLPALVPPSVTRENDLGSTLSDYSPDREALDGLCQWLEAPCTEQEKACRTETDAPLLVGNDPLIGWVAAKLTGRDTPVARGELVCLISEHGAGTRWRLLWTLSDDGEAESEAIRAKIKSKMNTAGALGAVIVGLTTFLLQNSFKKEPTIWEWLAFAALATSAGLYFATLFLYDTMQMPPRFWSSRFPPYSRNRFQAISVRLRYGHPSVSRPPTSTARVLQMSMVQVWTWIFTPATVLAGGGVAFLALGVAEDTKPLGLQAWQVLVAIVVLVTVTGAWVAWQRPDLGASD